MKKNEPKQFTTNYILNKTRPVIKHRIIVTSQSIDSESIIMICSSLFHFDQDYIFHHELCETIPLIYQIKFIIYYDFCIACQTVLDDADNGDNL